MSKILDVKLPTGSTIVHYPVLYFITTHSSSMEFLGVNDFTPDIDKAIAFPSIESAKQFLFDSYGEDTMLEIYCLTRGGFPARFELSLELAWSN